MCTSAKAGRISAAVGALAILCAVVATDPARGQANGKISRNFYLQPYAAGVTWEMGHDYIDHGATPAGNTGPMDMRANFPGQVIVAAADGIVVGVNDSRAGCGCHSAYGGCANAIKIKHANGEYTNYLHIAQGSATSRGIFNGTVVAAGQPIAVEGDVGWTCGSGRSATATPGCVNSVPSGAGPCGRHLHFEVRRLGSDEFVNPMTCGFAGNLYTNGFTYHSGDCTWIFPNDVTIQSSIGTNLNGIGHWQVFQAVHTVTAVTLTTSNQGAVVLHAGDRVRLMPGVHAAANSYFRAEIGPTNETAAAP